MQINIYVHQHIHTYNTYLAYAYTNACLWICLGLHVLVYMNLHHDYLATTHICEHIYLTVYTTTPKVHSVTILRLLLLVFDMTSLNPQN